MALFCAVAAILVWSSLATLGVSLGGVPPLFLIGASLSVGGLLSLPWARQWTLRLRSIAVGCYGMLAYHLLFVLALRNAPPVSANLVHYTWPALIVLLAPLIAKGKRIGAVHVLCALVGFAGAALAILGGGESARLQLAPGYLFAIGAALVWSTYSLSLARMGFCSTADVGLACLVSGGACLVLHALFEPAVGLSHSQVLQLLSLGIGPMGAAFYLWAYALEHGDPRVIGVMANGTPMLSTAMLALSGRGTITPTLLTAALLVSVASLVALLANSSAKRSRCVVEEA
jgi:drug/metabolite transporter (DMT)-like permease